jgi:glycosyltransferase involved in cell wall biosynthesis
MIRVLVLNSDTDGVGYWRCLMPHLTINDPDFEVDVRLLMDGTLNLLDENFISQYNIVFYNKMIPFAKPEYFNIFSEILKKHNIKLVFDIDDYWVLSSTHLNYDAWKKSNADKETINNIRTADYVITTTEFFAEKIREINPNVFVSPNSVNLTEQQWVFNRRQSDKIRFLWGGGISHLHDLRLMTKSIESLDKDFIKKSQFFMCGFDLRIRTPQGTIARSDPRTNQWSFFEDIFTKKGRYITNNAHRQYLNSYDDKDFGINEEHINEFYQRRWTKPILLYGTMYNEADVCLSPLKNNNSFNYHKSNLKVIEAGAHHCPLIASNYGPYTFDDIEGKKDGKQKGFLIDEYDVMGWYKIMKKYSDNPEMAREHGENMFEYVKNNYSYDVTGEKRKNFYKEICQK